MKVFQSWCNFTFHQDWFERRRERKEERGERCLWWSPVASIHLFTHNSSIPLFLSYSFLSSIQLSLFLFICSSLIPSSLLSLLRSIVLPFIIHAFIIITTRRDDEASKRDAWIYMFFFRWFDARNTPDFSLSLSLSPSRRSGLVQGGEKKWNSSVSPPTDSPLTHLLTQASKIPFLCLHIFSHLVPSSLPFVTHLILPFLHFSSFLLLSHFSSFPSFFNIFSVWCNWDQDSQEERE